MIARPEVAGVGISHPDRVVYPAPRLTKLDIARYYESIRDWIVPHVRGRPLTLVRCPEGFGGGCFFMKHSNKILIDYLRNNRTNTSIAAYSTRARAGAPVSVPLTWEELRVSLRPESFTVKTVPARLSRKPDPWKGYWNCRQRLTQQRVRAVAQQ